MSVFIYRLPDHPSFSMAFLTNLTLTLLHQLDLDPHLSSYFQSTICDVQPMLTEAAVKPESKLLPTDNLWCDIFENLRKDHKTRSAIVLTAQEAQLLIDTSEMDKLPDQTVSNASVSAILFTCGHHFTRQRFLDSVQRMQSDLSQRNHIMLHSTSVISGYYQQHRLEAIACPNCVLSAIEAIT